MAKKYAVQFKCRKIGNGFILTGHIENEAGSCREIEESFYSSLAALDAGISETLAEAETIADAIKASDRAYSNSLMGAYRSIIWGGSEADDSDDEDDDD